MGKIKSFEDLTVWQNGKLITVETYKLVKDFPANEVYGITSQMKRAALSVPANVAEGFGRYHYLDKAKFYLNARGSLYELKSHILIANELGFIQNGKSDNILNLIEDLSLSINNLINTTRSLKSQ